MSAPFAGRQPGRFTVYQGAGAPRAASPPPAPCAWRHGRKDHGASGVVAAVLSGRFAAERTVPRGSSVSIGGGAAMPENTGAKAHGGAGNRAKGTYQDRDKPSQIRFSNIAAGKGEGRGRMGVGVGAPRCTEGRRLPPSPPSPRAARCDLPWRDRDRAGAGACGGGCIWGLTQALVMLFGI